MALGRKYRYDETTSSDRWYPLEAELNYSIVHGRKVRRGRGTTLAISSSGVVFKAEDTIPTGLNIEVWLDWPVGLDKAIARSLYIHGKTLRSEDGQTNIRIVGYQFCTSDSKGRNRSVVSAKAPVSGAVLPLSSDKVAVRRPVVLFPRGYDHSE
jgi:hypothetical protein